VPEPEGIEIRGVGALVVRDLRREVLRPGQSDAQLRYRGDDDPGSLHLAAFAGERIVGVASVMREGLPGEPRPGDWRVRGMASAPDVRGRGIGSALLARCVEHARERGGARIWCNARVGARSVYERAGLRVRGERFELPEIGDHYLMLMDLPGAPV
jgi:ribosomal protein S18 acetylase RimI-like enzyme